MSNRGLKEVSAALWATQDHFKPRGCQTRAAAGNLTSNLPDSPNTWWCAACVRNVCVCHTHNVWTGHFTSMLASYVNDVESFLEVVYYISTQTSENTVNSQKQIVSDRVCKSLKSSWWHIVLLGDIPVRDRGNCLEEDQLRLMTLIKSTY